MKHLLLGILLALAGSHTSYGQVVDADWTTDFKVAKSKAQANKQPILMRFQGSDWCGNCWRLDTTLFETKAFIDYVDKKYVLVVLDFPNKPENKLPKKQAAENKVLFEKYNSGRGFPALIMLDPKGELLGRMSVARMPTEEYIIQLEKIYEDEWIGR